jgi:hypothetical protein
MPCLSPSAGQRYSCSRHVLEFLQVGVAGETRLFFGSRDLRLCTGDNLDEGGSPARGPDVAREIAPDGICHAARRAAISTVKLSRFE